MWVRYAASFDMPLFKKRYSNSLMNKTTKKLYALALGALSLNAFGQTAKPAYDWLHLPQIVQPIFRTDTLNILQFGAKPDGITLNTESINKAIETCSAKGGGVVLVPQGVWNTGPIILKSNVNLHLSRAAILQFTADKSQYHLVRGNFEGERAIRNQSPLSATDAENIAITGEGIIDGHGEAWRPVKHDKLTEPEWQKLIKSGGVLSEDQKTWYPSANYLKAERAPGAARLAAGKSLEDYAGIKDYLRPALLVFAGCKKVLLEGTTFQNSPGWCLHTLMCENLTFREVRVRNESYAQNGDGMDIESCSNVLVENSTLDCGDDGICIKSGKDAQGRARAMPTKNVIIRNNVVYYAHGGFVIGSEMSGGAHDIFVSDCSFMGTDNGLRFKTVRGRGGIVENIFIKNIAMRNILSNAILFDMYYFAKVPTAGGKVEIPAVDEGTPRFRNIYIDNVTCDGANKAMMIRGLPEMAIENINLKDVSISAKNGADIIDAKNITFNNVSLLCQQTKPLYNIENSQDVSLSNIKSLNQPQKFLNIGGERTKNISIKNASPVLKADDIEFSLGANKAILSISK